jgi:hypothetical protein
MERLEKNVDIDLFSKTVISVVGDEHHGHPVIASVTRNLFRATANYNIIHKFFSPVAPLEGRRMPAACDKNRYHLFGEKGMRLFICGSSLRFRPRSIPSRNYKKFFMILGLGGGIMLFYIGMAAYIIFGPSTDTYLLPKQISSLLKLSGMGIVCISMIVGGFFIEKIEKDTKLLLLLFGVFILILNIFLFSSSRYY